MNHFRLFCIFILFAVLFMSFLKLVDSQESGQKRKSVVKEGKVKSSQRAGDEDILTFNDDVEKMAKLKKLQEERAKKGELSEDDLEELRSKHKDLRKDVALQTLEHGQDSIERAVALHELGANLFKQGKFKEIYETSQEILRIYEIAYGVESEEAGKAMMNVALVGERIGEKTEARRMMLRNLYINTKLYGLESKEVLMTRARLTQARHADADYVPGITYKKYKKIVEREKKKAERRETLRDDL